MQFARSEAFPRQGRDLMNRDQLCEIGVSGSSAMTEGR